MTILLKHFLLCNPQASPEKQTADADTSTKKSVDAMVGEVRFSEMFKQLKLPSRLPSKVIISYLTILHQISNLL